MEYEYIMIVMIHKTAWMWKASVVACFKVPVSRNSKVLKKKKTPRQPLDTWKLNQGEESSEHNSCGLCFVNLHLLFGWCWYHAWLKCVLGIWWSRTLAQYQPRQTYNSLKISLLLVVKRLNNVTSSPQHVFLKNETVAKLKRLPPTTSEISVS